MRCVANSAISESALCQAKSARNELVPTAVILDNVSVLRRSKVRACAMAVNHSSFSSASSFHVECFGLLRGGVRNAVSGAQPNFSRVRTV